LGGRTARNAEPVDGDPDKARTFASELVGMTPDVIVSSSNLVIEIVQRETRTIPIVFVFVGDPVGSGFVTNVARPDGNLTGFPVFETTKLRRTSLVSGSWCIWKHSQSKKIYQNKNSDLFSICRFNTASRKRAGTSDYRKARL
jgi:hypothetical protein